MELDDLVAREHEGWTALCDGTAGDVYGRLMADHGVMVLGDGSIMDRGAVVTVLASSPPWDRYEISEPRLVPLVGGSAAIVYHGRAARGETVFEAAMCSVYEPGPDGPRLVLYSQTPVPSAS